MVQLTFERSMGNFRTKMEPIDDVSEYDHGIVVVISMMGFIGDVTMSGWLGFV